MIRVLIADDHERVREGLRDAFAAEKDILVVGEAADGQAALRLAHELRPHVVVLDHDMPELTGLEVARLLRQTIPALGIVLYTIDPAVRKDAFRAGVHAFVTKDAPHADLVGEIRRLGRTVVHEEPELTDALGDYLVAHGFLTPARLEEARRALQRERTAGKRRTLADVLREQNAVAPEALRDAVERQRRGSI